MAKKTEGRRYILKWNRRRLEWAKWFWVRLGDISMSSCLAFRDRWTDRDVIVDMYVSSVKMHMFISYIVSWEGLEAVTPSSNELTQEADLGFWYCSPKKEPGSLGKWLISRVGQGIYKMSLEHVMVPEWKKVLKEHNYGDSTKGQRDQPEKAPNGQR